MLNGEASGTSPMSATGNMPSHFYEAAIRALSVSALHSLPPHLLLGLGMDAATTAANSELPGTLQRSGQRAFANQGRPGRARSPFNERARGMLPIKASVTMPAHLFGGAKGRLPYGHKSDAPPPFTRGQNRGAKHGHLARASHLLSRPEDECHARPARPCRDPYRRKP